MLKGLLEGCVLEIIASKVTYGYDITDRLRKAGFADIVEGTVYTILLRLEKSQLITATKKPSNLGPPRKVYALTPDGKKELRQFWEKWKYVSTKINNLSRST